MPLRNLSEHSVHTGSDIKRLNSDVSRIGTDQSSESTKELEELLQCHKPDLMSPLANEPRNPTHREAVQKSTEDGITFIQDDKKNTQIIPEKVHFEEVNEDGYLQSLRKILKEGSKKIDRTGVGTLSVFGIQNRYSLKDGCLPLFTTKRVFFKGVLEELLWFIKGSTNNKDLQEKGVHIWDANGSKDFLNSVGLSDREEGDLGPIYGFQWRHWGAKYIDTKTDYSGQGIDQLKQVIEKIKSSPNDRRLIVSAWNVTDIPLMALPPCHCLFQFYVADGKLSCRLDQRSADMGLGVPFNVASYAMLTHMVANVTNLEPGEFIHQIGDAHIYLNHVEGINLQLSRKPRPFPKLVIKRKVTSIDDFTSEDFEVLNYNPHPKIKLEMAT